MGGRGKAIGMEKGEDEESTRGIVTDAQSCIRIRPGILSG